MPRQPQGDKWAQEVGETYLRVLTRPNYKTHVVEKLVLLRSFFDPFYRAVIEQDENRYVFTVKFNRTSVLVHVHPLDQDGELDFEGHFKYQKTFSRSKPEKVRKSAIVLAKKLSMRSIMDVMHC